MNRQLTILYVEDDPQSRKIMRMLLKTRMGLSNVTILEDSSDFQQRIAELGQKPDLIFLDIHVKPLDGFEMLDELRKLSWVGRTPIVALTASVMNEEVERLRTAGFSGCLAKPIDMDTFPDTMQRILDGETIWRIIE